MVTAMPKLFPGPTGFENLRGFMRHRDFYLEYIEGLRKKYGDVVSFNLHGWKHLVFHPREVERVLGASHKDFIKGDNAMEFKYIQGNGPTLSAGDDWLRQRRVINPQLKRSALERFIPVINSEVNEIAEAWDEAARRGTERDVAADMAQLSFGVATRCLLGIEIGELSKEFQELTNLGLEATIKRITAPVLTPMWVPSWANRTLRRVERGLDRLTYAIIEKEQRAPSGGFVSRMIETYRVERDAVDVKKELRDQLVTLIMAGYETSANALTWAWYLLERHPDVLHRVREEAKAAGRDLSSLAKLTYTRQVLDEAMRLYPPVPYLTRKNTVPVEIAGRELPAGSGVDVSVWSVHRHPEIWPTPDRFDPDRFAPERVSGRSGYAHLPFAAGPRECAGREFAELEMALVLAELASRFRVGLDPGRPVVPIATVVVRPKDGLRARIETN
jgi:cytochrome P450